MTKDSFKDLDKAIDFVKTDASGIKNFKTAIAEVLKDIKAPLADDNVKSIKESIKGMEKAWDEALKKKTPQERREYYQLYAKFYLTNILKSLLKILIAISFNKVQTFKNGLDTLRSNQQEYRNEKAEILKNQHDNSSDSSGLITNTAMSFDINKAADILAKLQEGITDLQESIKTHEKRIGNVFKTMKNNLKIMKSEYNNLAKEVKKLIKLQNDMGFVMNKKAFFSASDYGKSKEYQMTKTKNEAAKKKVAKDLGVNFK